MINFKKYDIKTFYKYSVEINSAIANEQRTNEVN